MFLFHPGSGQCHFLGHKNPVCELPAGPADVKPERRPGRSRSENYSNRAELHGVRISFWRPPENKDRFAPAPGKPKKFEGNYQVDTLRSQKEQGHHQRKLS